MPDQQKIWDSIAPSWQEYRQKPLDEAKNFLKDKKGRILDVGCGSGRHFSCIKGKIYAVDFSGKMLEYAKQKAKELEKNVVIIKSTAEALPFDDETFDAAICIAVIHCIPSEKGRKKALKELFRILKPKARGLIVVWSKNQERIHGRTGDIKVPWTHDGKKHQRYYYIFEKEELENLLISAGFRIISSREDDRIVFEVEKHDLPQ